MGFNMTICIMRNLVKNMLKCSNSVNQHVSTIFNKDRYGNREEWQIPLDKILNNNKSQNKKYINLISKKKKKKRPLHAVGTIYIKAWSSL